MEKPPEQINGLGTNELEAYIDSRYEAGAPQDELESLETAFAGRVSDSAFAWRMRNVVRTFNGGIENVNVPLEQSGTCNPMGCQLLAGG